MSIVTGLFGSVVVLVAAEAKPSKSITRPTVAAYSLCISFVEVLANSWAHLELASITVEPNITGAPLVVVLLVS